MRLIPRFGCRRSIVAMLSLGVLTYGIVWGQPAAGATSDDLDQPPIDYDRTNGDNPVARLQVKLREKKAVIPFEERAGYLRGLLRELSIPESSQTLVYSKTSLQRHRITPRTPRAIYFNDDVYVAFCRNGEMIEISAADTRLGTAYYTMDQRADHRPRLDRHGQSCLGCHGASATRNIPGHLIRSLYVNGDGLPILSAGSHRVDQSTPHAHRWGGWYVTGEGGATNHRGNLVMRANEVEEPTDNGGGLTSEQLSARMDAAAYLSADSDLVALLVLAHQVEGHNRIARAALETRIALHREAEMNRILGKEPSERLESTDRIIASVTEPLVRYLLFDGEQPLEKPASGTTAFAHDFAQRGPRDRQGRSFRDFDLKRRLFAYPCSYLVYTEAFDHLPVVCKDYVAKRFEYLLSDENASEMPHLASDDRRAIREILHETKPGFLK